MFNNNIILISSLYCLLATLSRVNNLSGSNLQKEFSISSHKFDVGYNRV